MNTEYPRSQKEPSVRFDSSREDGLQVLWEDNERAFCRRWHASADGSSGSVLVVLPASEHPSPSNLERLADEYGLRDELDSAWAVRPLALKREHGRIVLVLEDWGGEPLDRLLSTPMEIGSFLRLAIGIVTTLGKMHRRGLIHKDIKPANIVVNCEDGQARLTGFGIASRLPRERQAPEPPEVIAGTLAYMAPEQTGRMNRSIDSRSDLYALGVTFYQMLTSRLPFSAADPMEWVHCHIARKPIAPAGRVESVPAPISEIVMKLLAKAAEDRYQTATGLEHDLRRCLAEWELKGRVEPFALGERDAPDRLMIPEKLYGREREVETLLAAFNRVVASGAPELVLVSGSSGIGKSSVVNELHKALVPPCGLFASGKFDQYKRDIPYSTLVQAFQSLVKPLLSKSDAELTTWREAFLEALSPNGRLMVDLIPELKLVIGEQLLAPELPPQEAKARFQLMFRRFIGVFAQPQHPLALFLDDLQWLDAATLDLLGDLLTQADVQHLLLIGAYRDNEVDAAHPLMRKLTAIRNSEARVSDIRLGPLGHQHVGQLIADALRCELEDAAALSELVHAKTAGNPFFVLQFVYALADEGLFAFDHQAQRSFWDPDRIRGKGYADNVVDLMVGKLTRLPEESQKALQQLSCLGNVADVTTLANVLGSSEEEVHTALWEAVRLELVESLPGAYRFAHDRVQEAAYSLIPETARGAAHLRIGKLLVARMPPENREEAIFEIVNQLNRGGPLITSPEEREQLAELNLLAGKRAKASAAYASALTYLVAGATLLAEDRWERQHELTFALELGRAECEFLTGEPSIADERLNVLSIRATNTVELASVACLRVDLYTTLGQSSRAINVGLDYLRHLGVDWSPHPTEEEVRSEYQQIWSHLGNRTIEELLDLPLMSDPASLATLDLLTKLEPPALFTDANLYSRIVYRAVNLSIEHGNCDGSCFAYVRLGMDAGARFGNYQAAFCFGSLGYDLVEQRGLTRYQARTYMLFGAHVMPGNRHIRAGRDLLRRAFDIANRTSDLIFAGYSCFNLTENLLAAGDPLAEVQRESEHGLAFARNAQFEQVADVITSQLALVRMLRGLTRKFGSFDDEQFDELQTERRFSSTPDLAFAECCYWIQKLQALYHAGDYASAVEASSRAQRHALSGVLFFAAHFHFYSALSHAACCDATPAGDRQQHLGALGSHHKQIQVLAENCPENFENRAALIGAEIARIEGRDVDAEHLYEKAISSAHANGFVHNEALANELASRFYAARGFVKIANAYLRDARYGYLRWGADGKVRQLDELHPHLRDAEPMPGGGRTGTIATPVEHLDLATVIKVSQAVSGEMVLEKLVDTLLRTAIEQAGAERGLLLLPRGGDALRIDAEGTADGKGVIVHPRNEAVGAAVLPESVLQYVLRTRESVTLDDAAAQSPFTADPYIRQRQVRSVLCLPLINQAKLIGVVYLENNLAPRVFAPSRIPVLKLLASQAAISLENARLYRDLAEREAKIRRLVDANIIGIFIWDIKGHVLEANDAFLRMVGYERQELMLGRVRWRDMTPAEWQDRGALAIQDLAMTGTALPYEKEYLRKDGSRVPVLLGVANFDESADQGVAFVLDLTERKRAEAALRESEEQWKAVFENNPIMYFMVGETGTILSVNPFGAEQLGYKANELIGRPVQSVFHEADREAVRRNAATCFEQLGQALSWELRKIRKNGEVIWVRETARATSINNRPVLLIVCEDITEGKRTADTLREVQTELAHANRVAALGQLTASIAHEVNQPLSSAHNNAGAALNFLDSRPPNLGELREALCCVVNDTDRAGDVIKRIRALVKKAPPRTERLDMNEAIRDVIVITRGEAAKNRISVEVQLEEPSPQIRGDRVQLQQVILNLIINAIEAMSGMDAPRELLIKTARSEADGVLVVVQDTGPGVAPETLSRAFEAFYTTKPEGLGIGLSICRSIVEAHGGRLWANPNVPRGAIFQFTLPDRQAQPLN